MIQNERQYKITSKQVANLSSSLNELLESDDDDWVIEVEINALKSQIADLKSELNDYELLKEGKVSFASNTNLSNLPKTLIQARIAKGLSQKELADALDMKEQQIQRYEATMYMGASLSRLIEISNILEIKITEAWEGKDSESGNTIFVWENGDDIEWNKFPVKEMIKRGWLALSDGISIENTVKDFFVNTGSFSYTTALHRKKFHGENKPNNYSLLAWQAKIIEKATQVHQLKSVSNFEFDDSWVNDLVYLSTKDDAPLAVKNHLAEKGIILIIEEHLSSTYLDGAAMLLETGNPVVAMTLRYDRLDNFWFVLLHEIGHIFLHLFDSLNMDFFDEECGDDEDQIEKEANLYALNMLIPEEKWELCLSRFSTSDESVIADAENLKIDPSIIAGRIRKEQNNYTILNNLIGQGKVRTCFEDGR